MSEKYGVLEELYKCRVSPFTHDRVFIMLYHEPSADYSVVLQSADKEEALTGLTYSKARDKLEMLLKWWS